MPSASMSPVSWLKVIFWPESRCFRRAQRPVRSEPSSAPLARTPPFAPPHCDRPPSNAHCHAGRSASTRRRRPIAHRHLWRWPSASALPSSFRSVSTLPVATRSFALPAAPKSTDNLSALNLDCDVAVSFHSIVPRSNVSACCIGFGSPGFPTRKIHLQDIGGQLLLPFRSSGPAGSGEHFREVSTVSLDSPVPTFLHQRGPPARLHSRTSLADFPPPRSCAPNLRAPNVPSSGRRTTFLEPVGPFPPVETNIGR